MNQETLPYVVIHGHFYQPPRENPWTGLVERQKEASPYHDWNELITYQCYIPNSWARVLNKKGKIVDIVNNYSYISFNFGPTLFSWLEKNFPSVTERILQADKESLEKNDKCGNAIAQV
ncbi:glycoside hydrolase, partial [Candidatus Aerophobetes bacterium]|nr:glycoside hydrolase [Candidatus Aerophobetes bacterium]